MHKPCPGFSTPIISHHNGSEGLGPKGLIGDIGMTCAQQVPEEPSMIVYTVHNYIDKLRQAAKTTKTGY